MTYKRGVLTGILVTLATLGSGAVIWWLLRPGSATPVKAATFPPPATVSRLAKEDQFNVITLTEEAQQRLRLQTARIELKTMHRQRLYGGEVTIPPGQAIVVSAPLGGTLKAPPGGMPRPGRTVTRGQMIFQLQPLLTPEGRVNLASAVIEADGQVNNARTQVNAARIALDRARQMLRDEAGSRRQVDEAQAVFDLATKTQEAATARRALLGRVAGEVEKGTASTLPLESPESGILRNVNALRGQTVPSGAALFEVVNLDRVWVRVPVYVGDVPDIDADAEAEAGNLAGWWEQGGEPARPVAAPPSANAAAGTVDLYYELDNNPPRFSPGERIGLSLPLLSEAESLTAPWQAILFDIYGGAWVYQQTGERTYVRRRVVVHHVAGDTAVLEDGPPPGTRVVTAGAAELFGTEVGFAK